LIIEDYQEGPDINPMTWKQIETGLPPKQKLYIKSETIPKKIYIGQYLVSKDEPIAIKKKYKGVFKGKYDPKKSYKLGDIVKYKSNHYVNLLEADAAPQELPSIVEGQWKKIKLILSKAEIEQKADEEAAIEAE
jgi:hypothetical protein